MRVAIFSDVHSNLPALEAVLADIRGQRVERSYCLGDVVGYAPFADEVIDVLRREGIPTVMGNYDDGVGFDRDECGCAYKEPEERRLGDLSFQWTKAHVTVENKAWLRSLEPQIRFEAHGTRYLLVHGSPRRINEYLFEDRPLASFRHIARDAQADVIVCGHTHRPYTKEVDGVLFVNVGSAGKPKDGDPRACYALLDLQPSGVEVTFRRISYDLEMVTAAIRASELPTVFAVQLERATGELVPSASPR